MTIVNSNLEGGGGFLLHFLKKFPSFMLFKHNGNIFVNKNAKKVIMEKILKIPDF